MDFTIFPAKHDLDLHTSQIALPEQEATLWNNLHQSSSSCRVQQIFLFYYRGVGSMNSHCSSADGFLIAHICGQLAFVNKFVHYPTDKYQKKIGFFDSFANRQINLGMYQPSQLNYVFKWLHYQKCWWSSDKYTKNLSWIFFLARALNLVKYCNVIQ